MNDDVERGVLGESIYPSFVSKSTQVCVPPPRNYSGEFSLESPVFVFRESAGRGTFWGVGMKGLRIADGGDW